MRSDGFKKLLATDASTIEGQDFIAGYNGINNWAQLEEKGKKDGLIQDQADSNFYLLKSVKAKGNKDNVWISFYEGLHCHAGQDKPVPVTNHRSRRYQDQTTTTENTLTYETKRLTHEISKTHRHMRWCKSCHLNCKFPPRGWIV